MHARGVGPIEVLVAGDGADDRLVRASVFEGIVKLIADNWAENGRVCVCAYRIVILVADYWRYDVGDGVVGLQNC